jgi:hypothetical protein
MSKKFLEICESVTQRYTRGGFLVGDFVKMVDGHERHEPYKMLGSNVKEMITQMLQTGLNLRVVGINDAMPARYPGNPETSNGEVRVTIAVDNGGGRYTHYCDIPVCCVEPVDHYPNLAPIPDVCVRPNGTIIKPEELVMNTSNKLAVDQTMMADQGGSKKKVNISLPTKNIKIPAHTVKGAKSPSVDNYTINYMQGV